MMPEMSEEARVELEKLRTALTQASRALGWIHAVLTDLQCPVLGNRVWNVYQDCIRALDDLRTLEAAKPKKK